MEFSGQEYWSGLPFPSPGDLPDLGIKFTSHRFPALAGGFFTTSAIWEASTFPLLIEKIFFLKFNSLNFWLHWVFIVAHGLSPVVVAGQGTTLCVVCDFLF